MVQYEKGAVSAPLQKVLGIMVSSRLTACLGLVALAIPAVPASALDQLPLPEASRSHRVEVATFAPISASRAALICSELLAGDAALSKPQKIRAIKAYRACRAEKALQQLAVATWERRPY
jgi:hypothetical protein